MQNRYNESSRLSENFNYLAAVCGQQLSSIHSGTSQLHRGIGAVYFKSRT